MFDSGANVTLIDSVIRKHAYIKGKRGKLGIQGVNAVESHDSFICDFVIINPETNDSYRINSVPSVKFDRPAIVVHAQYLAEKQFKIYLV